MDLPNFFGPIVPRNLHQTAWTQTVRNRMRQKAGEIQTYHSYEKGTEKWRKEYMPRKGQGGISEEGQEILEDRDIWTNKTTLHRVIHESNWENGWSWPRFGLKTKGECYKRILIRSRPTSGFTRLRRKRNQTDATYAKSSGWRKTGSRWRRISLNKPWVISNTPVKSYQQPILILTTNVGDWSMESQHGWQLQNGSSCEFRERNDSRHYGMIYHPRSRAYSTLTSHRILYGTLQEIRKWNVPSHKWKTEKSKRVNQRK